MGRNRPRFPRLPPVHILALLLVTALAGAVEGPWRRDVDAAIADGRGQPMVLVFSADWCVWCHRLLEEAAADADVVTALQEVVAIEVDIDRHPHLAQRLSVQGVPAAIFVNRRGEAVDRVTGYRPAAELLPHIEQLLVAGDDQQGPPLELWADQDLAERATADLVVALGHGTTAERRARRHILGQRADLDPAALWPLLDHPRLRVRVDASAVLAGLVGAPDSYDPFATPLARREAAAQWRGGEPAIP